MVLLRRSKGMEVWNVSSLIFLCLKKGWDGLFSSQFLVPRMGEWRVLLLSDWGYCSQEFLPALWIKLENLMNLANARISWFSS